MNRAGRALRADGRALGAPGRSTPSHTRRFRKRNDFEIKQVLLPFHAQRALILNFQMPNFSEIDYSETVENPIDNFFAESGVDAALNGTPKGEQQQTYLRTSRARDVGFFRFFTTK